MSSSSTLFEISNDKLTSDKMVFSVAEYIDFLNEVITHQRAIVQGEVGKIDDRGNYTFFTLLDTNEDAVLNCFIWNSRLSSTGVEVEEGMELQVEGYGRIFRRRGSFTFEVEHISLVGEGALKIALEKLKQKLQSHGFFSLERKKSLPSYLQRIGLVTSTYADAKNDFLTHLGQFGFQTYFYNVRVEGIYAIDDNVEAIRWFNENLPSADVLVLTRGGGSLESLQAYNSEPLARAIFASKIPVVTGIGHENDETIADLVADVHASTPTDAARIISDPWRNANMLVSNFQDSITSIIFTTCAGMEERLSAYRQFFISSLQKYLLSCLEKANYLSKELIYLFQTIFENYRKTEISFLNNWERITNKVLQTRLSVSRAENDLKKESTRWYGHIRDIICICEEKLKLADPTFRLKQGYSIVFDKSSKIVKSSNYLRIGDSLKLKFYQGQASSTVESVEKI